MTIDEWRSRPMIFVDDLEVPVLSDQDLHHYRRVRRVRDGAQVTLGDGVGGWRPARFGAMPEPEGPTRSEPRSLRPSTVGFAPVKGDRPELVVQKLTELGVDTIVPLQSARSVVRWDAARAEKNLTKWRAIVREAAMQSRRVHIPIVEPVTTLTDLLAGSAADVVFAEPGAEPLDPSTDRFVLIGPEGGWDPEELRGQRQCSLPGGILRAETAAIAAGVLLATAP